MNTDRLFPYYEAVKALPPEPEKDQWLRVADFFIKTCRRLMPKDAALKDAGFTAEIAAWRDRRAMERLQRLNAIKAELKRRGVPLGGIHA